MKRFLLKFLAINCIWFYSCSDAGSKQNVSAGNGNETRNEILGNMYSTDSLQFIFYDNPGIDSMRYSRYFKFYNTSDSIVIRSLIKQLKQNYRVQDTTGSCRSEGKIYLFSGGSPLKTIYFSTVKTCNYTYFIKDGMFYYMQLQDDLAEMIKSIRKRMD